jgi:hypothetical protein
MKKLHPLRLVVALAATLLLGQPLVSVAQTTTPAKGTPKLQPRPSETSGIPSGQDAGTPATSNSAPLGTVVMPSTAAEREGVRRESAAARAASRKRAPVAASAASAAAASAARPADAAASVAAARP